MKKIDEDSTPKMVAARFTRAKHCGWKPRLEEKLTTSQKPGALFLIQLLSD